MATQPDEPPESIVLGTFKGIRNTVARERLAMDELQAARDIDLDDSGQPRRRRGRTLKLAGNFHSLKNIGERILGVKDGVLGVVGTDYTFTSLGATVGSERLGYTQVDQTTFFSSLDASGKILGSAVSAWGAADDAGVWLSPVVTPSDTLGEVFGRFIKAPPMAQEIAAHNGRIYLAAGKYLWATELFLFDYVDKTRNFIQFESEITLLAPVDDGLYVGTGKGLYFLSGTLSEGHKSKKVHSGHVIRGSATYAPATDFGADYMSEAVVAMTDRGVCVCMNGGQVTDRTAGMVVFPEAQSAAPLYREDAGANSYVVVTDSRGGPQANARIGDFVDAEIIRGGS